MRHERRRHKMSATGLLVRLCSAIHVTPHPYRRRNLSGGVAGYTILEVLIFLSVTAVLFIIAMSAFNGEQARAEFNTSIREVNAKFQDVINNVGSGLYSNNGNISCTVAANRVQLGGAATAEGSNAKCIYIGQMIHFAPGSNSNLLNVYSIAGLRQVPGTGKEVTSIEESNPQVIAKGNGVAHNQFGPDTTDAYNMPYGLRVTRVTYSDSGPWQDTGSVGFFTTFNQYGGGGFLSSGSTQTDLVVLRPPFGGDLTTPQDNMVTKMDTALDDASKYILNPSNGVRVCLESDASKQVAIAVISGAKSISTDLQVFKDRAAANTALSGVCP